MSNTIHDSDELVSKMSETINKVMDTFCAKMDKDSDTILNDQENIAKLIKANMELASLIESIKADAANNLANYKAELHSAKHKCESYEQRIVDMMKRCERLQEKYDDLHTKYDKLVEKNEELVEKLLVKSNGVARSDVKINM